MDSPEKEFSFLLKFIQQDSLVEFKNYINTIDIKDKILNTFCRDACLFGSLKIANYLLDELQITPSYKQDNGKDVSVIFMLKNKIYQLPEGKKAINYFLLIKKLETHPAYKKLGDENVIDLEVHLKNDENYKKMKEESKLQVILKNL